MSSHCLTRLESLSAGLLALLAFMIPISTTGAHVLLGLCFISWLLHVRRDLGSALNSMLSEPVTRAILGLLAFFVVGTLYSEAPWADIKTSLFKMGKWLYLPFLVSLIRQSHRKSWVIDALVWSMMLTLFLAILKINHVISWWPVRFTETCVFKDHIFTNLMMSFTAFILAHKAADASGLGKRISFITLFVGSVYYVLFMSEGRSGYIMFILLWVFFCFQKQKGRYRILGMAMLISLLLLAGFYFSTFQRRILQVVHTAALVQISPSKDDKSIRERLVFIENTLTCIKIHPWFGSGTGSFKTVYAKNALNRQWPMTANSHNEYLNISLQLGIAGLGALLWFFYTLYKSIAALQRPEQYYAQGLLGMMVVGCMGNAWLMDFTSGCFFMVCLAACLATRGSYVQHRI